MDDMQARDIKLNTDEASKTVESNVFHESYEGNPSLTDRQLRKDHYHSSKDLGLDHQKISVEDYHNDGDLSGTDFQVKVLDEFVSSDMPRNGNNPSFIQSEGTNEKANSTHCMSAQPNSSKKKKVDQVYGVYSKPMKEFSPLRRTTKTNASGSMHTKRPLKHS